MAGKPIDIVGNRYGTLVVIRQVSPPPNSAGRYAWFLCKCDCGKEISVRSHSLVQGGTKSCGDSVHRIIDISGNKYGKLIAIKFIDTTAKSGHARWLCKCECGNTKIVIAPLLKSGGVKSCGCLHSLAKGESTFNKIYDSYKRNAIKRNYIWELTKEQVKYITKQNCFYCGIEPNTTSAPKKSNGAYTYNGIDRIDNTKGYITNNIVPCCEHCNKAKRVLSVKGFKDLICRIYTNWASK